jgi:hypothetical protein
MPCRTVPHDDSCRVEMERSRRGQYAACFHRLPRQESAWGSTTSVDFLLRSISTRQESAWGCTRGTVRPGRTAFFSRLTSRAGLTTNQRRPRINYSSYLLNSSAVKTTACVRSVFMAPCQKENSARPFHASPTLLRNSQPPSRSFSFRSSQQPLIEFERGPMGTLDHVQ